MSGDRGWEDLFGPLGDDERDASGTDTPAVPEVDSVTESLKDPFGFDLSAPAPVFPAVADPVTSAPAAEDAPAVDPFAAMRARQEAAQRAADPGAAAQPTSAQSPIEPSPIAASPAASPGAAPLTRRELRELERTGQTGAVDLGTAGVAASSLPTTASESTDAAGDVPALVEPPAATTLTGPVFAAAWSAAAPPVATTVDADVPPPVTEPSAAETVPAASAAESVGSAAPAPDVLTPATQPVSWSTVDSADDAAAAGLAAGASGTTPAWFAAAESVAPAAAATTVAAAAGAASSQAAATPALRTSSTTGLEDWRPRPVAGGGFPIPITVGGGAGRGAGGGAGDGGAGGSSARPPRKRRSKRWLAILIPILVVLGLVGAAGVWAWSNYEDKIREVLGWELQNDFEGAGNGQEVIVTIRSGDIGADIARTLHDAGVTMSFDAFYDLLLEQDPEPVFETGNYTLQQQMSAQAALTALQDPANKLTARLVIPEGSVLPDVLAIMSSTTGIPLEEITAAAATPQAFGVPAEAPSLEGYLFPATYELDGSETATGLIQRLVDETFIRLDALAVPVEDRHRVLTLASLVQRESGPVEGDPAKVARVFLNRLAIPMNLESDATVAYGTGNLHTVWTTDEERADASNPYNTYANPGLPIGPIGAPGEVAIQAALAPAEGPWLFFVPINLATGETMFSETVEQHEAYVDQLWEWCDASDENASYCE